ncbi:hypothetical protein CHS0354_038379 [Potamilus streckersoni]|uniref:Condensation domain-containing protein n=1 Tax=Potamilus streckersoni TaxID=2493646 RepID=A0AAE0S5T5_9BIVA|nr:hypothetical protein CHS0354_038379 [Potamilus streckersoni]
MKSENHETDYFNNDHLSPSPHMTRALGTLELIYHRHFLAGMDIASIALHISSREPLTDDHVRTAMFCIARKHPLFRMRIVKDQINECMYNFLEMKPILIDFRHENSKHWRYLMSEEGSVKFDVENGPLWRCRLISVKETWDKTGMPTAEKIQLNCQYIFLLSAHHAIADTTYFKWFLSDFIHYMRSAQRLEGIEPIYSHPLYPPIDCILSAVDGNVPRENTSIKSERNDTVLKEYNFRFANEILSLSDKSVKSLVQNFTLNSVETRRVMEMCKRNEAKLSGAVIAAMTFAFVRLVYGNADRTCNLVIPIEILVDLRRFLPPSIQDNLNGFPYPGVGSNHTEQCFSICTSEDVTQSTNMWKAARRCSNEIQENLRSGYYLRNIAPKDKVHEKGKSHIVMCFSNNGSLSQDTNIAQSDDIQFRDCLSSSTIVIDDSPIFFVTCHTQHGQLSVSIIYTQNYTSDETAVTFMGYIHSLLTNSSKL